MPKLPTDPQDMERMVIEIAAASFKNAREQHDGAQALLDREQWPLAFSVAALASEEVGKATLCITMLTMPSAIRDEARAEFNKAYNDHQAKARFAHFVLAVSAEEMPASVEQMIQDVLESAHRTNAVKFRGLYVDYTDTGELLEPEDVTEEEARWMVGTVARLLEDAAPAASAVTDDPDSYLDVMRRWHDSMDYEALGARIEAAPMEFLAEARAFARDEAPPSASILGARLAEQLAAVAGPSELPSGTEEEQPIIS